MEIVGGVPAGSEVVVDVSESEDTDDVNVGPPNPGTAGSLESLNIVVRMNKEMVTDSPPSNSPPSNSPPSNSPPSNSPPSNSSILSTSQEDFNPMLAYYPHDPLLPAYCPSPKKKAVKKSMLSSHSPPVVPPVPGSNCYLLSSSNILTSKH
ncbi:hypothetical protein DACRYDRAFT_103048 [Dacryopinax primogenitus]|uniref:Uncharacterized protein n=1 Tax=Dacryopinax primogenitus (strain DJM 731) TaxID=1858805 RepID=M5GB09_DACPD|nr:uncharacterized protein DACRYDRAFT_103048 [Dacryopinax primogenitus]EJU06099.1 hypothetical protein DACRYDRAFT_103048 [Dacryopinax primogenitus]